MKSAGLRVGPKDKEAINRLIELMNQGMEPDKVRQELKFDWIDFNTCLQKAARQLRPIVPDGEFIMPTRWLTYIPESLREGFGGRELSERERRALRAFRTEKKDKFVLPGHPDIQYIPFDRLNDCSKELFENGIVEGSPLVLYTALADHDGLRAGASYIFTSGAVARLRLYDPMMMANRIFNAKRPVGSLNQVAIRNSDVSYGEAQHLVGGGYVAVRAPRDMGLGEQGFKITRGDVCWMKKEDAVGLEDISQTVLAERERLSAEKDRELAKRRASGRKTFTKATTVKK